MTNHEPERTNMINCGGIVLCGGKSRRMGLAKAMLPFGPEPMLCRVIRLLGEAVTPVVVVAAPEQTLPNLPSEIQVVYDRNPDRGPLEGLAAGLRALAPPAEAAYVTSCDVPMLRPDFVRRLVQLLGGHDIVVPRDDEHHHALSAVYRTALLPSIQRLLDCDRLRPFFLFSQARTRQIDVEDLKDVDPTLSSLRNLNHPADYLDALEQAGFTAPPDVLEKLQVR